VGRGDCCVFFSVEDAERCCGGGREEECCTNNDEEKTDEELKHWTANGRQLGYVREVKVWLRGGNPNRGDSAKRIAAKSRCCFVASERSTFKTRAPKGLVPMHSMRASRAYVSKVKVRPTIAHQLSVALLLLNLLQQLVQPLVQQTINPTR